MCDFVVVGCYCDFAVVIWAAMCLLFVGDIGCCCCCCDIVCLFVVLIVVFVCRYL